MIMTTTINGHMAQHEPRSANVRPGRCHLAQQQTATKISSRINDVIRELHDIRDLVREQLIPLQIIEYARELGRVPQLKELEANVRDKSIISREAFRATARPVLEHLRAGQERPGDRGARHGCGSTHSPGIGHLETTVSHDCLMKPPAPGCQKQASAPAQPSVVSPKKDW